MSRAVVTIRGETHLSLEVVAESYAVDVAWVREVYEVGLLGEGVLVEQTVVIPARMLDRVAEIRRLNAYLGLSLDALQALFL